MNHADEIDHEEIAANEAHLRDEHRQATAELPTYPGEPALEFVEIDAEGFAVYRRPTVAPGSYRTNDGDTIIVVAPEVDVQPCDQCGSALVYTHPDGRRTIAHRPEYGCSL